MNRNAIIVSGLPASGKTTVGRAVSRLLDMPFLDKDDFLEQLFEEKGVGDLAWRRQLSTESNSLFEQQAARLESVVLVSHWRQSAASQSGTPTDWLSKNFDNIIEVCCRCLPEAATERFISRSRHNGHLDESRNSEESLKWMHELAAGYPLNVGAVIEIVTDGEPDYSELVAQVKRSIR